ncbi:MAG: hypothetical protein LUO79_07805 [Methanomassiliicoccales archaeon]|nr:hypothetical protein [Methanomassiliicoccales archaeon]
MKRVVIESPLAGAFARNQRYAKLAMIDCIRRGEAPFASHVLYPLLLNDATPEDRRLGMECGFAWAGQADLCAVYVDLGVSSGMVEGMRRAQNSKILIERRNLPPDLMAQLDQELAVAIRPTEGAQ